MKKFLSILFIMVAGFFLVACSEKSHADVFKETLITFGQDDNINSVTKNVTLVDKSAAVADAKITWESNNPAVIKIEGNQGVVTRPDVDTTVKLTVKVSIKEIIQAKEFDLKVLKTTNVANEFTITFDANGGVGAPTAVKVAKDNLVTIPSSAPTKDGHIFVGWFKEAAGTNVWNFVSDKVTANVTLYAKWTPIINATEYNVTFDANGGAGAPNSVKVLKDGLVVTPTQIPTKAGFTFVGWYKEAAGTNAWNFGTDKVTANVTLYAKWKGADFPQVKEFAFDFTTNDLGNSYKANINVTKNITNTVSSSNFPVLVSRAGVTTNATYPDNFLVLSASTTDVADDLAFIEFNFGKAISKMEFDAAYWGSFDAAQVTSLSLQVKNGDSWTDVYNIKQALADTLTYKKVTITGLTGTNYRIYGVGVDPTGAGANGARIMFDNINVYSGGAPVGGDDDTIAPVINGATDMTFTVGAEEPNWLESIEAYDNVDEDVAVLIASTNVNLNIAGTYTIVYEAIDAAGNRATVTITVTVQDEVVPGNETKEYEFDFATNDLGYSFSSNTNASKRITNLVENSDFSVIVTRTASNTNHTVYTNPFLVMSYASRKADVDAAFIEFNFAKPINKMTFDAAYWSGYDVTDTKKVSLQVKDGSTWKDVFDIKAALNGSLEYKNITITGLNATNYRIYGEGIDPTGTGDNGSRIMYDNMCIYTSEVIPAEKLNVEKDTKDLSIVSTFMEAGVITLPATGTKESTIAWSFKDATNVNNALINLTTKQVTMPTTGQVSVTVVANLTNGEYTGTKEFTILIGEGEPIAVSAARALSNGSQLKTKGVVTSLYQTTEGIYFFLQDGGAGLYIVAPTSFASQIVVGNEISIIGFKQTDNGQVLLNNVKKVEVLGTVEVTPQKVNNPLVLGYSLGTHVEMSGLLQKSYTGTETEFVLVTKDGVVEVVLPQALNAKVKTNIQNALSNKESGIQVVVKAGVYRNGTKNQLLLVDVKNVTVDETLNVAVVKEVLTAQITLPAVTSPVSANMTLPTTTNVMNGVTITWTSNNAAVISNAGAVKTGAEEVVVRLSYEVKLNNNLINSGFIDVTVAKESSYSGYYATIAGLTGTALKAELTKILSNYTAFAYGSVTTSTLQASDLDLKDSSKLLLIYSHTTHTKVWSGGNDWNKEHIWPQSKLGIAPNGDIHNLRACNSSINSSRGNLAFVDGSGTYGKQSGGWYPGDASKGDVARIVFYMNTHWGIEIGTSVIGNLNMFIEWHNEDPVDEFEIKRNQVIFEKQKNRNPYIDHPELVEKVYGKATLSVEEFVDVTGVTQISYTVDFVQRYEINFSELERKSYSL